MIEFNNQYHADQIATAAGTIFNPRGDTCISRTGEAGKLLGGVIYNGYTGASIGFHVAGFDPNWVNRDMLWVCFHYPFVQLGCSRVFGQVPKKNAAALEFDRKIGFNIVATIEGVFADDDLVVLSMTREQCRWLKLAPRKLATTQGGL